eukprot:scaffold87249_cov69-Phaeocystis_antarctica.AAC.1
MVGSEQCVACQGVRLARVGAAQEEEPGEHRPLRIDRRGAARARVGGERVEQRGGEDVHRGAHAAEGRLW